MKKQFNLTLISETAHSNVSTFNFSFTICSSVLVLQAQFRIAPRYMAKIFFIKLEVDDGVM